MIGFFLKKNDPFSYVLRKTRAACGAVFVFSFCINTLMLVSSIYMLQVYDRVLSSQSVETLLGLSLIAAAAFVLQGFLEVSRQAILVRIGLLLNKELFPFVSRALVLLNLSGSSPAEASQPIQDLDSVRSFLYSFGPAAIMDLPFLPVFILFLFFLHPLVGLLAVFGAVVIFATAFYSSLSTQEISRKLISETGQRNFLSDVIRRNASEVKALGMEASLLRKLTHIQNKYVSYQTSFADFVGGVGSFTKTFRFMLQSASLGLGAYLVIKNELSPGAMIASSILLSRALAPVEAIVSSWRPLLSAQQGYIRLRSFLPRIEPLLNHKRFLLNSPQKTLTLEGVFLAPPGKREPIVFDVNFTLVAGQAIGLIGPSGSGKSTLARGIVGTILPVRGSVRLDNALIDHWDSEIIGKSIGYLSQDTELMEGTIAENIARFEEEISPEKVLKASEDAGAHDMILRFSEGYSTYIQERGRSLSIGQRQRIALARALYGDPFLVVLDEPNANLDMEGDEALKKAILAVRERGGIVILITHKPSGLVGVDQVVIMSEGKIVSSMSSAEFFEKQKKIFLNRTLNS